MLKDKKIILGVTGSISAYKATFLIRLLIKSGAEVKVVTTASALDFITPLSLSTLSKNPIYSDFTESKDQGTWTNHVELGLWADLMIIAPATANTLSKMANGHADNFLLATYLSAKCPVYIAPAMDLDMYKHKSTKDNIAKLESFDNRIIPAESGELASGLSGEGRLAEPENIVRFLELDLKSRLKLNNKKVLITAGPTYEKIDPVRFIGNHSSGKMGYALAEVCADLGADVKLVSGPSSLKIDSPFVSVHRIISAEEMYLEVMKNVEDYDVVIMAAAVADYTPVSFSDKKIKKKDGDLSIELKRTKDILKSVGEIKMDSQILVGFALETNNEVENAKSKLVRKNLDFIVLNSLQDKGAGFKKDTNKISIIDKNNKITNFELKTKKEVAEDIVSYIVKLKLASETN